ncbi:MAG: DUF1622 domain-containing protein [Anaerolineaceae bacterium]|nr:DUF1622 domain-containing protein [Anaerolineaceae bacterium]
MFTDFFGLTHLAAELSGLELIIEILAEIVEAAGVLIIIIGIICSVFRYIRGTGTICFSIRTEDYRQLRKELGRSLLIGLEFLVAGDIIHTVAVKPTSQNLLVLGLLVALRLFLSVALELEIDGRWPWQAPTSVEKDGYDKSD